MTLGLTMPDVGESWTLMVRNGALSHHEGAGDADARSRSTATDLNEVILGITPMTDQIERGPASSKATSRRYTTLSRCSTSSSSGSTS